MNFNFVKRLIGKYGDDTILKVVVQDPNYDDLVGDYPKDVTFFDMPAVMTNYSSNELIEGVINIDDVQALIETDKIPTKEWLVNYNGFDYRIINIQRVSTQNYIVVYKLQLRK